MKRKMWMTTALGLAIATTWILFYTAEGRAVGEEQASSGRLLSQRLLGSERVMDVNPAAPGLRGNEVPNINRWNAMMVHSSHQELRRQGAGTSPDGEVTSYTRQNVTGSQTRRVAQ